MCDPCRVWPEGPTECRASSSPQQQASAANPAVQQPRDIGLHVMFLPVGATCRWHFHHALRIFDAS